MTISIEKLPVAPMGSIDSGCYVENVFTSPAFRQALAREFKLTAITIHLPFAGKTVHIPAFLRSQLWGFGRETLVIGAGFDKTGQIDDLSSDEYNACMETLLHALGSTNQRIGAVELRTTQHIPCQHNHSDKVELLVQLDKPCAERLMDFSKSTRRNIRLPFKEGFHFELDNRPELLDAFYALYLQNMHELGSLPHSLGFFQEIAQNCRENVTLFVGYMDKQPVVSSFIFLSSEEAYGAWSGTHPDYKQHNVFLTMLWSITEFCEQTGRKRYNLGRSSRGSGSCQFKMRLANEVRDIHYYRLPIPAAASPDGNRPGLYEGASWVIRQTPPFVMQALSRSLLHRFY